MRIFIKGLSTFLFLNVSLFAVDVSKFEIDGIKLGTTYSNVKKKLSCNKPLDDIGSYNIVYMLECGHNEDEAISITFDKNKRLIEIGKSIQFSSKLDWSDIKTKLYKKYGKPTDDSDKSGNNNSNNIAYKAVWGAYPLNYEYTSRDSIEGKGLQVYLSAHSPSSIHLNLVDGYKLRKAWKELDRAERLQEERKRKKEIQNAF